MGRQSSSSRGSHPPPPGWYTGPGLRVTPVHIQFFLSGPISTLWSERGMVGLLLRVNNCASLPRTEGPPHPTPRIRSHFQTSNCHYTSKTSNKYLPVSKPQLKWASEEGSCLWTVVKTSEMVHIKRTVAQQENLTFIITPTSRAHLGAYFS